VPLRRRVAIVAAAAVAVAIVLVAIVSYWAVRRELRGQVDDALRAQYAAAQRGDFHGLDQGPPGIPASAGGPAQYVQSVTAGLGVTYRSGELVLPVDARVLRIASAGSGTYMGDLHLGANHLRELIFGVTIFNAAGQPVGLFAVQLARPLNQVDHVLAELRLILFLLGAGGIALAAALGRIAARRALAPLAEVARTAQQIGETDDLSPRLKIHADDEVGQLARRFNLMLDRLEASRAALDESVRAQRQLVADASHELRTPVTSLRTNVEVLLAGHQLDDEDRDRLLTDVVEQSEELTALVGDLIDLARGDLPSGETEDVRLDRIAEESVARSRRNSSGVTFATSFEPVVVEGSAERLERAINNLLDNAARHSPRNGTVEVIVDRGGVRVRDHGTGVDEADLPHVFDRFFRGANTRGQQGSGLGLAIVRQVAEQHGGSVSADNAPGGGAIFTIRLPTVPDADAAHTGWDAHAADEQAGTATAGDRH
jgi:two-component system, OmpR family, sensor histidine kinase MprB